MIKPVRKVRIIVPKESKEELLIALQKEKLVMIEKHEDNNIVNTDFENQIISRANNALNKLSPYKKKGRKFFKHTNVAYKDFINNQDERISLLEDVESKFDELHFLKSEIKDEQKLIDNVIAFKNLEYTTKELSETLYTTFYLGYISDSRWEVTNNYVSRVGLKLIEYEYNDKGHHVLIYLDNDNAQKQLAQLERFGFVKLDLPILDVTIKEYINEKQAFINENNKKIKEIEKYLTKIADKKEIELQILVDQTIAQKDRNLVVYTEAGNDVAFDGWISLEIADNLQGIVRNVTLDYQLEFEEPTSVDNVPTLLKNNEFVKPFESITNTYSVPNYREVDPNPIMSIWYIIIFGVLMGDIGYGLLLLIGGLLFLRKQKPKGEMGDLIKVFTYGGAAATIMGIFYGSVFGVTVDLGAIFGNWLGKTGWSTILLSPMEDPMQMLIFSLGLGSLHLISGLVMKMVVSVKQGKYLDGLADGLSWILILIGIVLVAINMAMPIASLQMAGLISIVAGVAVMIIAGGLRKDTIMGKIFGGLGGLFDVTNYLSDILSYSRILALALSTAVIAFTMNLLAGMIQGSAIGFVLSILVYLVGHAFNLAISLLSAYVQNNRLQYLEFYGKFYEGGGYLFEPLSFKTTYINEITKTEEQ